MKIIIPNSKKIIICRQILKINKIGMKIQIKKLMFIKKNLDK